MKRFALCFGSILLIAGCGAPAPDLDSRLSVQAQDAAYPDLIPLAPLLAETGQSTVRDSAIEGASLEARAAALRRRAAALNRMPLS